MLKAMTSKLLGLVSMLALVLCVTPAVAQAADSAYPFDTVDSVELFIGEPIVGSTPAPTAGTGSGPYSVLSVKWYDTTSGSPVVFPGNKEFEAEHKYSVTITVETQDKFQFKEGGPEAKINGKTPKSTVTSSVKTASYEMEFTPVPSRGDSIRKVELFVAEPVVGLAPATQFGTGNGEYDRAQENSIVWLDATNPDELITLPRDVRFQAGHKY